MKLYTVILFLLLGVSFSAGAQTMPEVEQQIKTYLDGMSYWRFEYNEDDTSFGYEVSREDSVNSINENLFNYIETTVVRTPGILKKSPRLPENSDMNILVSDDKKLSIYNWDAHITPSKLLCNAVGLFDAGNGKTATRPLGHALLKDTLVSAGFRYAEILTVLGKGKTYYLLVLTGNHTDAVKFKTIAAFTINNGQLELAEIFVENGSKAHHKIYLYDYMSNYDFEKMKEINDIHLSKNGKKLYIPEVENNQMTGGWQVYTFDGTNFVYDKIEK